MPENSPRVGVGVLIIKDGKYLVGKRKNSHGAGEWAFAGGHLEYMESIEECAKREVMEEAGIEIENVRFLRLENNKQYKPKHYVDIGVVADWKSGEPQVLEPDKRENWEWRDLDDIPEPLFEICRTYFEAYQSGKKFFDA